MSKTSDINMLLGVGISALVLSLLSYCLPILCYKLKPKSKYMQSLQVNQRLFALLATFLFPCLSLTYWLPDLVKYYSLTWISCQLLMVLAGIDAIWTFLYVLIFPKECPPFVERVISVLRFCVYLGLSYYSYHSFMPQDDTSKRVFLGLCWSFIIFCILRFIWIIIFEKTNHRYVITSLIVKKIKWLAYALIVVLTIMYGVTWLDKKPVMVSNILNTAFFMIMAMMVFETLLSLVFDYFFKIKKGKVVNSLIPTLCRIVIYGTLAMMVAANYFHKDLSSLLVSSTALSVVLGLAVQESLGNLLAGLTMNAAAAYKKDDFIEVNGIMGTVKSTDWRCTTLVNADGGESLIPNSVINKCTVTNYSKKGTIHSSVIKVGADYDHSPAEVRRVMIEAALSVSGVLNDPSPGVLLTEFADSSIEYALRYYLDDYSRHVSIDSQVREAIWYYFNRHNISIPYPIRTVMSGDADSAEERLEEMCSILRQVDFLSEVEDGLLRKLAKGSRKLLFAPQEIVFNVGDPSNAFYIVVNGKFQLDYADTDAGPGPSVYVEPDGWFGEMDLLTGAPRRLSARALEEGELIVLDKAAFSRMLKDSPDVQKLISDRLAQRHEFLADARSTAQDDSLEETASVDGQSDEERDSSLILIKMRNFFKL